jgi:hypothetical protein
VQGIAQLDAILEQCQQVGRVGLRRGGESGGQDQLAIAEAER